MRAHARIAVVVAALTIAGSAFAAAEATPKVGLIYAYVDGGTPVLHRDPKNDAPAVAHPPNGARVRFVEVIGGESQPAWYHVDQLGMTAGWLQASDARTEAPKRRTGQPLIRVDLGDLTVKTDTAITSAARGLDARVLSYGSETSRADALQQLVDLTHAVDLQMQDVPYTGQEKGNHRPGSRFNHTAAGRTRDAQSFRDGLADAKGDGK